MVQKKVAFIGLGVMGFSIAGHLAKAGYDVCVYNRTQSRVDLWLKHHVGCSAKTPEEAAKNAEIVFTCVSDDEVLKEVTMTRHGAFFGMKADSVLVDHSTSSAKVARYLHEEAARLSISFMDAPISGGQQGAEAGNLTIMVGGEKRVFDNISPLFSAYACLARYMGPSGSGQLTKMVNQICIAGIVQGLAEGIHFAKQAGLDIPTVMAVTSKGAAQSWQMQNRYETMMKGEYNHGFAVDLMKKDLAICLDEARNNCASLPVAALIDQLYAQIQRRGGGRWDNSSLLALLDEDAM